MVNHNSSKDSLDQIRKLFITFNFENIKCNLKIEEFEKKINKTNQQKKQSTDNQISNMCNIYLIRIVKNAEDLIYFVEDDYIHEKDSISEMIFTYERIASQINDEIVICPSD